MPPKRECPDGVTSDDDGPKSYKVVCVYWIVWAREQQAWDRFQLGRNEGVEEDGLQP